MYWARGRDKSRPYGFRRVLLTSKGFDAMTHVSIPTTLVQLVARSRKLGADRSIANWGGGNTSAKAEGVDFRGHPARILWVKGSGSDLATCTEASFTGLFLDDVLPLLDRERMSDTEMVNYLAHCFSEPGRPRPSIETLLHGFLPFTHIDHTHADATNYFACAANGEKRQILRFEDGEDVLDFAGSQDVPRLTKIGAACPDQLVHTKPWPLLVEWMPDQNVEALVDALRSGVATYVAQYHRYLEENAQQ